ncbi:uncharacterized protein ZK1073.1-like isoform X1 [Strongylocentrotus purpuratus]|uniref:Uncharacterized protein n=1 Tax=Strongylocentrotus purpuratus TaxID=7668 RepID=A0A7M7NUT5_STRPU|nr:uncharacterized protein ZK1073.1-like isoform X1 [Strongylocentrotus purpuratus]
MADSNIDTASMASIPEPVEKRVRSEHFGDFYCYVQGDPVHQKHVVVTFHDIGLNHTSWVKFISTKAMAPMVGKVCFIHINAPGQQDNAEDLPDTYRYPKMQELAEEIPGILKELGVPENREVIGLGEGAGSNVLLRLAMKFPKRILALCLLECTTTSAGFSEWGSEKVASWQLKHGHKMTANAEKYILWHHLGRRTHSTEYVDIVKQYHENLYKMMNAHNLGLFIDAFCNRTNINNHLKDFSLPVFLVTGSKSPHVHEVEKIYEMLPSKKNSQILIAKDVGGDIKEENSNSLAESLQLFLQGVGIIGSVGIPGLHQMSVKPRSGSMTDYDKANPSNK